MDANIVAPKSLLGRILRFPLRLIPQSAHVRVLRGPLRGQHWIVGSSSSGCWLGITETAKQLAFAESVKRGKVVFDLGANVGHYTLLACLQVGPEGRVFSFEPLPRNLGFLRKHLKLNNVTNCTVWEAAVGNAEGTANFVSSNPFMGHLTTDSKGTLTVKVVKLDDLVASQQIPPPDLIKCDIEGGEYDALMGASFILEKYGPPVFLATHGIEVHQKCCRLLTNFGYQLKSIDGLPVEQTSEILAVRNAT